MNQQIRTKVIVLGSSGAGKTSFIRRYFHKTFRDERKSTRCADFYSTLLPNPLMEEGKNQSNEGKHISISRNKNGSRETGSIVTSKSATKSRKSKKHKKKKHKKKKHDKDSSYNAEIVVTNNVTPNRRDNNRKEVLSAINMSSDPSAKILHNKQVALQMWDTAGKERLLTESAGLTSRLGDSFFRHANAAILIYDATSSRSFLQLIKWHSELLERISRVQSEDYEPSLGLDGSREKIDGWIGRGRQVLNTKRKKRRFPILVVATKLDRLKAEQSKSGNIRTVPQRHVLGINKGFKGHDYHYEYRTDLQHCGEDEEESEASNDLSSSKKRMSLSYGLEGGSWAKDKAYMDYVRMAEDELNPDRIMVKRWCRRNGLQHIEVSALEDMGIDIAVKTVVSLGLKEMIEQEKEKAQEELHRQLYGSSLGADPHHLRGGKKVSEENKCKFCQFFSHKLMQHY